MQIPSSNGMFLVDNGKLTLDDNGKHNADSISIFKIQFLATCKVENFEKEMLIAFYIEQESGFLDTYILSSLPNGHYQDKNFGLVDYKSYCENCELTGETTLSFPEYFFKVKENPMGVNTLVRWENVIYNADWIFQLNRPLFSGLNRPLIFNCNF